MTRKSSYSLVPMEEFDKRFFINNPEAIRTFINVAIEDYLKDGNQKELSEALSLVVKWVGASNLARKTNMSRQGIYNAVKPTTKPAFSTVLNMLHGAGFRLTVV